jgi:hypothetical protein
MDLWMTKTAYLPHEMKISTGEVKAYNRLAKSSESLHE